MSDSAAYDHEHQQIRERLLPQAYNTPCPRCGLLMLKGQRLHLGHSVDRAKDPTAKGDRIEHADCNESAGGDLSQEIRRYQPSRDWFEGMGR